MSYRIKGALLAPALMAAASVAYAQGAQPPALPPTTPGSSTTIPEKTPSSPATSGTLSDKLDKSDGVIKPAENVDPAMSKPVPQTQGTMPVVKPPEEKGGPTAK